MKSILIKWCAALLFCAGLAGCQTTSPVQAQDWPDAAEPVVRLQPGDVVAVRFVYWPELDDEQSVRPDGMISLKLAGDVPAEGRTPEELRLALTELYQDKIRDPEISVLVRSFDSHRVYVGGEVQRPGIIQMQGKLTALEAIMEAGGFLKGSAKPSSVVLLRLSEGKHHARTLDLRQALESGESEAVALQPRDVLFVPRTTIDKVDQFVDQYINQIIPEQVSLTFLHEFGQEEQVQTNAGTTINN